MIEKKQVLTVLGRRNKQQILKDVLRPGPSVTVSSPTPGSGSTGRGDGCTPGGAVEEVPALSSYCVETFTRDVPIGDGWGTSEFFENAEWEPLDVAFDGVQNGFGILGPGGETECEAPMGIPMQIKMDFKLDGSGGTVHAFDLFCWNDADINVGFYQEVGEDAIFYILSGPQDDQVVVPNIPLGTMYSIRFDITDSTVSGTFWETGTQEPSPQVSITEPSNPVSTNELYFISGTVGTGLSVQFDRIEIMGTLVGDRIWHPGGGVTTMYCSFDDFYQNFNLGATADIPMGYWPQLGEQSHGAYSNVGHIPNVTHWDKSIVNMSGTAGGPTLGEMGAYNALLWTFTGSWLDTGPDVVTFRLYANVAPTMPPTGQGVDPSDYYTSGLYLGEVTLEKESVSGGRKLRTTAVELVTTKDFSSEILRFETTMTTTGLDLEVNPQVHGIVGCEPVITRSIGYFTSTLVENDDGWAPENPPVYYTNVFFDGLQVFVDDHYTIDASMNIVPNVGITPTSVQANYVIR